MTNVPAHVAIIPDGNRRWAKKHGLRPWLGHDTALQNLVKVWSAFFDLGVRHVTFWAASSDNLTKRSAIEVKFLLKLLEKGLRDKSLREFCHAYQVRMRVLGHWRKYVKSTGLTEEIEALEQETKKYSTRFLTVLFAYDGITEMVEAVQKLHKTVKMSVSAKDIRSALWTGFLPDVDLVIRTGGEPHWSAGFMMWLTANSQFYFTESLWPDFGKKDAELALADYARRARRLGA